MNEYERARLEQELIEQELIEQELKKAREAREATRIAYSNTHGAMGFQGPNTSPADTQRLVAAYYERYKGECSKCGRLHEEYGEYAQDFYCRPTCDGVVFPRKRDETVDRLFQACKESFGKLVNVQDKLLKELDVLSNKLSVLIPEGIENDLGALEDNWDGKGSPKPTAEVIAKARAFAIRATNFNLNVLLSANPIGGVDVHLTGDNPGRRAAHFFRNSGEVSITFEDEKGLVSPVTEPLSGILLVPFLQAATDETECTT